MTSLKDGNVRTHAQLRAQLVWEMRGRRLWHDLNFGASTPPSTSQALDGVLPAGSAGMGRMGQTVGLDLHMVRALDLVAHDETAAQAAHLTKNTT